jgi:hypothetical protein
MGYFRLKYVILILIFLMRIIPSQAQEQQVVPYTLADRDRIIQMEVKMAALEQKVDARFTALEQKMDTKFEAVNSRIDYLFWLMSFIGALIIAMFSYLIWDRRTALKPALEKAQTADLKSGSILIMLRDYAKENGELSKFMKRHGLL